MACHNLLQNSTMPVGTTKLLGLGLNFCLRETSIKATTKNTFQRMNGNVRRVWALRCNKEDGDYIKKLYLNSDYRFIESLPAIEKAKHSFKKAVKKKQLAISKRRRLSRNIGNISHGQWNMIKSLKNNNRFIDLQGDKNLGTCFLEQK